MGNVTSSVAAKFTFFPPDPSMYNVQRDDDGRVRVWRDEIDDGRLVGVVGPPSSPADVDEYSKTEIRAMKLIQSIFEGNEAYGTPAKGWSQENTKAHHDLPEQHK
ncbi:hypothetical protein LOK49_LG14G00944 [Camellia lanceoleosa]|uniref:Uncharacterized protein n=1 Tax=Camellia lanceoleosa TaxID=1840588 RepID=A0ACC0F9R1_9ERIC|nr:hypothetical protein LOK49_LG14G00944 [Camellia lanceoleosa]